MKIYLDNPKYDAIVKGGRIFDNEGNSKPIKLGIDSKGNKYIDFD